MAFLIQRTFTKQNPNSLFFKDKSKILKKYKDVFKEAGKLLSEDTTYSQDTLVMTYSSLWISQEAYDEYLGITELQEVWKTRNKYNKENNIISTKQVSEV